jgi:ubiquinone/menaquinone biosynthesis C-methylase UbiE
MVPAARWFCTTVPYQVAARWVLLPWALHGVHPGGDALEIGAGSGAMAAQLLARHPTLRLVVSDYDSGMLTRAARNVSAFSGRVNLQQADATRLPFEDDRFDMVLSFAVLHHVGDWRAAVGEGVRVLRRGDASSATTPSTCFPRGCCTWARARRCA